MNRTDEAMTTVSSTPTRSREADVRNADLHCPACASLLVETTSAVTCSKCRQSWTVQHGVPEFVTDFPYWGEIPHEHMTEVLANAAARGWKSALLDSPHDCVRRPSEMILNLDRANWKWLTGLPAESRVLDVGAGMGANSHALATRFRGVVALEPVSERIEFMRHRFAQEGLANIRVVQSSLWTLPFAPESFDLIAMNGVLEWVPQGQTGDPRELQLRALRNMQRLLRPGGSFYLGIENRFTPGYFVGHPDPHCGLPYVTILPRPLAHWYARRRGQPGYRNYLYSSRGYRRLLKSAGFRNVDIYVALPSYNHPRYLIPLQRNIFSYYTNNFSAVPRSRIRSILHKLMLNSGMMQHLEYSYVILAQK